MGTMTEWRDVPGYEGSYQVSDDGQVKSLTRVINYRNGRTKTIHGRLLKGVLAGYGYEQVSLGRGNRFYIHHLVVLAFVGPRPKGMDICHNNGIMTDNRLENLRYDTKSENTLDNVRLGKHNHASRTHCANGHPFAGENLHTRSDGGRRCLTCHKNLQREIRLRRKGKA